jgi:hypothetical protein
MQREPLPTPSNFKLSCKDQENQNSGSKSHKNSTFRWETFALPFSAVTGSPANRSQLEAAFAMQINNDSPRVVGEAFILVIF